MLSPVNSSTISTSLLSNNVTSPKQSPTTNSSMMANHVDGITTISDNDEDDKNNNSINKDSSDENCENDTISVTGSPEHTSNSVDIEDDRKSPPLTGAFTSLIQKNGTSHPWRTHKYNPELLPQFTHSNQSAFNQAALAAQLFLQNPLIPSSSQWLYNQLYGNQQEFPWFRHGFLNGQNNSLRPTNLASINDATATTTTENTTGTGINLSKRPLTDTTTEPDREIDRKSSSKSPISVSSTKRSPSPEPRTKLKKKSVTITDTNNKKRGSDVWRPY